MDTVAIDLYNPPCVGVCGRAVDTSNSRSGGPGFIKPRPSRCFLRQGPSLHFVSVFAPVYMGIGDILPSDGLACRPGRGRGGGGGG